MRDLNSSRRLTWNRYWRRSVVAHWGDLGPSLGESQDVLIIIDHQCAGHGYLLGWDAGWIFGQNIFFEITNLVLVVTETGQIDHPEKLRSYSCLT